MSRNFRKEYDLIDNSDCCTRQHERFWHRYVMRDGTKNLIHKRLDVLRECATIDCHREEFTFLPYNWILASVAEWNTR